MSEPLQPLTLPLWGSRLIEASAGTGKTWTIAALYLRLVLGHGKPASADGAPDGTAFGRPLHPSEILVMTFTRAATRELSDRIRQRLSQAAEAFRQADDTAVTDPFLRALMADHPPGPERERAAWRLATAADAMDEAAVHTIDGWCQRMLREHAFDSRNPFDETLVPDERALVHQAVLDHWRHGVYPLPPELADEVLALWPSPDVLARDLAPMLGALSRGVGGQGDMPDASLSLVQALGPALQHQRDTLMRLAEGWPARVGALAAWFDAHVGKGRHLNGNSLRADSRRAWLDSLAAWSAQPRVKLPEGMVKLLEKLSEEGLEGCLLKGQSLPPLIAEVHDLRQLHQTLQALPDLSQALRWHAALRVRDTVARLKRQQATFSFADLLERMALGLAGPQGQRLRERIAAQYPVALIDEFQDTSPRQFDIFNLIHPVADNRRDQALFLIGDPKQSIYRFRGADIHSYLQAREATLGRHYVLGTNHRSTQALVGAVNRLFVQAEALHASGAFAFGKHGARALPFEAVQAKGRDEVLLGGPARQPLPALTLGVTAENLSAPDAQARLAAHAAETLAGWLEDPHCVLHDATHDRERRLNPGDVAVLVRNGREARAVRQQMARRGIASVYLSDRDSVFDTDEAADLLVWLQAVASPRDLRLARSAWGSALVGLSLPQLMASHDDAVLDEQLDTLVELQGVWQRQGVLAMLRQTLQRLQLARRWLGQAQGERRLTNVLHLAELLQDASATLEGPQALIRWMAEQLLDPDAPEAEERIVRLESDADLVQVITIHKSKGLEYPVVMLPFAASRRPERAGRGAIELTDDTGHRELVLDPDKARAAQADEARLSEDLRLMYVALTRARHALWLGVARQTGRSPVKWDPANSALGWLIGAEADTTVDDLDALLEPWHAGHPEVLLQRLGARPGFTRVKPRSEPPPLREQAPYQGVFERQWSIGSFTALTRDLPQDQRAAPVLAPPGNTPSNPSDMAAPWHRFPRGALPGHVLHGLLEWLMEEGFDALQHESFAERLQRRLDRQGFGRWAADLQAWLQTLARRELPVLGAPLGGLKLTVPEMEFWMPATQLEASRLDALCCRQFFPDIERPALVQRQLRGLLMGFADLVLEHEGRYWVLDYKSNQLGPDDAHYGPSHLAEALCHHRYDVQGAIYMLALHRLLRLRLGEAYQPQRHLGGAIFQFLRGIEHPQAGCCVLPADAAWLDELDACFLPEAAPGEPCA